MRSELSDGAVMGGLTAVPGSVDEAITSRISARAFLPDPVPRQTVEHILGVASRAPSGTNMQPWQVHVVTGRARRSLVDAIMQVRLSGAEMPPREYKYYPDAFPEPYLGRRRAVGWALYGLLGIERGEKERMFEQQSRNFAFFDAPVGLIFTIDKRLELGSWLDYGMFIQNVMIAARAQGLHTCPQAAFCNYHEVIRKELGFSEQQALVCGMSLGHADPAAPENSLISERASVAEFATFIED